MKLILALAGGGIKGVFQLSVLKAIFDNPKSKNIEIIDIYATSVGALISPFILTKQFDKAIEFVRSLSSVESISIAHNSYYIPYFDMIVGYYNFIFNKSYYKSLDLSVLKKFKKSLNHTEEQLISENLHCHVFNVNTGKEEMLTGSDWIDNIEASATIALLYPEKKIGNNYYIDGGISSRLAIENIETNKNNENHILMINFNKKLEESKYINTKSLNIIEYTVNLISQSADLHSIDDYEKFMNKIDIDKFHKITMDTKFESLFDFDKYTIERAMNEGYTKGKEWIEKLNIQP